MFSSPAIHVFSQENPDKGPRKPANNNTNIFSRKPFQDRTINYISPSAKSEQKEKCLFKQEIKKCEDTKPELKEDLFFYDAFSFKDINDNFTDVAFNSIKKENTLNILRSYIQYADPKTPPPCISFELDFVKIPEMDFHKFQDEGFYEPVEETVDELSVPDLDLSY